MTDKSKSLKDTENKIKAVRFLLHRCVFLLDHCREKTRQHRHVKEHKEFYERRVKTVKRDQERLLSCFLLLKRRAAYLKFELQREQLLSGVGRVVSIIT